MATNMQAQFESSELSLGKRGNNRSFPLGDLVGSFRFLRVSGFIVLCFLWAILFYGVENNFNPMYALGRNISTQAALQNNGTLPVFIPGVDTPAGLAFVDALFMSVSFWTSTGLQTIDFSRWILASQIIGLFAMVIGSLLWQTSIPVLVRICLIRRNIPHANLYAEYRGIVLVAATIALYYVVFAVIMSTFFAIYCATAPDIRPYFETAVPPINPWFGGYFIALSAFSNCGFSPFQASVVPFVTSSGFILWLCLFMLTGNIAFPLVLHAMLLLMGGLGLEKRFGLPIQLVHRNPRDYYQMLFPFRYLFFLSIFWMGLWVVNFSLFLGLEWDNTMAALDPGQKLAAAIFSATTNRTAGLNVLPTGNYRSAYLVFVMVMFIVSSNPNAITMRATSADATAKSATRYTKELLINVVAGLSLCWVVILLFELSNPWVATPFPTLFEIASAFGTVGLSLGFGTSAASLVGAYTIPSKFVIMILMTVGAHRTLPANVDPAISVKIVPSAPHVVAVDLPQFRKQFITKAPLSWLKPNE